MFPPSASSKCLIWLQGSSWLWGWRSPSSWPTFKATCSVIIMKHLRHHVTLDVGKKNQMYETCIIMNIIISTCSGPASKKHTSYQLCEQLWPAWCTFWRYIYIYEVTEVCFVSCGYFALSHCTVSLWPDQNCILCSRWNIMCLSEIDGEAKFNMRSLEWGVQ